MTATALVAAFVAVLGVVREPLAASLASATPAAGHVDAGRCSRRARW